MKFNKFINVTMRDFLIENKNSSKKKLRLINESNISGKTIINVDIQPEYIDFITFDLYDWVKYINEKATDNKIIFLYNGEETLDMINLITYIEWLMELGIEENVINNVSFYDKGYAFFRYCMDNSIEEDNIVDLIKFMIKHNINDSRDIDDEMWDTYMKESNHDQQDVRDLMENAEDMLYIPDLMEYLKDLSNILLLGGGINQCLKEVELALLSLNKDFHAISEFIY